MEEKIIQIIGGIRINVDVSVKHINFVKNPATQSWKNWKYLASITDDSVITYDEITDVEAKSYEKETKTVSKILIKKTPAKHKVDIFYLHFLLIIIALLITA